VKLRLNSSGLQRDTL